MQRAEDEDMFGDWVDLEQLAKHAEAPARPARRGSDSEHEAGAETDDDEEAGDDDDDDDGSGADDDDNGYTDTIAFSCTLDSSVYSYMLFSTEQSAILQSSFEIRAHRYKSSLYKRALSIFNRSRPKMTKNQCIYKFNIETEDN